MITATIAVFSLPGIDRASVCEELAKRIPGGVCFCTSKREGSLSDFVHHLQANTHQESVLIVEMPIDSTAVIALSNHLYGKTPEDKRLYSMYLSLDESLIKEILVHVADMDKLNFQKEETLWSQTMKCVDDRSAKLVFVPVTESLHDIEVIVLDCLRRTEKFFGISHSKVLPLVETVRG